jgi:hypothetical protein
MIKSETLSASKGQEALVTAKRRNNGELFKFPIETAKEIIEFYEAGITKEEIASHFDITQGQVDWVRGSRFWGANILGRQRRGNGNAKTKRANKKCSVQINYETHKWISGLAVVFGIKRGDVLDRLASEAKGDERFLSLLLKEM